MPRLKKTTRSVAAKCKTVPEAGKNDDSDDSTTTTPVKKTKTFSVNNDVQKLIDQRMETPPPIDGDEVSLEDGKPHANQHTETQKAQETQQKPMTTAAMAATALRETSVVLSLP